MQKNILQSATVQWAQMQSESQSHRAFVAPARRARRACSPLLLILRSLFSQFRPFFVGNRTLLPPSSFQRLLIPFPTDSRVAIVFPRQIPEKCLSHVICRSSDSSQNIRRLPASSFCTRLAGHSSQISPSSKPTPRGQKEF